MSTAAIQRAARAAILNAAVATSQIFPFFNASPINSPLAPCILNCPGSLRLEQKTFFVRASGIVTCATAAYTALVSLYGALVTPAVPFTAANWSLLGASGATTIGVATGGFIIESEMSFDSVSGKLQGVLKSIVNNTYVAPVALTNALTLINGATEPAMVFAVGVTFGTAAATNVAQLTDFCLDA